MPVPKKHTYTYADLLTWDVEECYELINGVYMMSPSPSRRHQRIGGEIYRQISNYLLHKKCQVYYAPFDVRLFEKEGDLPKDVTTVVQPDIVVVCDRSKLDDAGCKGAPDLVIEILSPSNPAHDRVTKFNLYAQAGVREYWIVSPAEKTVMVFLLENGTFVPKHCGTASETLKVDILEDCTIDLSLVFSE